LVGLLTVATMFHSIENCYEQGAISRQQPIYILCQYIPAREWVCVECELEKCDYLLRDPIGDLIGQENWGDD
jgi:hypothetical protein